jgi:hypothetical protein
LEIKKGDGAMPTSPLHDNQAQRARLVIRRLALLRKGAVLDLDLERDVSPGKVTARGLKSRQLAKARKWLESECTPDELSVLVQFIYLCPFVLSDHLTWVRRLLFQELEKMETAMVA